MHPKNEIKDLIDSQRSVIMGVSAIWVFLYHQWIPLWEGSWFSYFCNFGLAGVDFFLLLSGMGVVYALEKYSTLKFYFRRLERVFLPFFVIETIFKVRRGWDLHYFLKNLLCINFYTKHILSTLWFVPAILTLYIFSPLFYHFFRRAKSKERFILLSLAAWFALTLLSAGVPCLNEYFQRTWMFLFTNRIPIFLTGIYLGWVLKNRHLEFKKRHWVACCFVWCLGFYAMELTYNQGKQLLVPESYCFLPTYLLAISGVLLTAKGAALLMRYGGKVGEISLHFFSFFGRLSLEFYCVHESVAEKIKMLFEGSCHPLTVNFLMFAGSALAALILDAMCNIIRKGIAWLCRRAKLSCLK